MRDNLEAFIAKGGNVAFFSGNSVCWQVRSEADGRAFTCWKQNYHTDPVFQTRDFKTLEGVVWGLLTLSSKCPDKRFSSPFFPDAISSTSPGEGAQPLCMYFRGLRRDGRKVVLRFTGDANRYLNNTAAIQELVKGALEATIRLHTTKYTTVYYEIDGQIVEEWDA